MATATLPVPSAPLTDTSSMTAGLPADVLSAFAEAPTSIGTDDSTPPDDAPPEEPAVAEPGNSTPVIDDAPPADAPPDEPIAAEPADATVPAQVEPTEELDEGISRAKGRDGKEVYNLTPNRYKTVYDGYKLTREASEVLNEPLTLDGVKHLAEVSQAHERMWNHLTSGEPEQQARVLGEIIHEMGVAHADGETGVDPSIPFATTIYSTLRDQAPDAYAHLRLQAARDLVGEMYETAASTGDRGLFASAQQFAVALAGIGPKPADMTDAAYAAHVREVTSRSQIPFFSLDEMQGLQRGEDPIAARDLRIRQLESQLTGRQGTSTLEQFRNWDRSTRQSVQDAIFNDAVKPSLSSIEATWKDFPNDYNDLVVDRLHRLVSTDVKNDQALNARAIELNAQAQRATSPQVRERIAQEIKQLFVNRANFAVEKHKLAVAKFAADALKGRSTQTNQRRTAAQTRTAPNGTGTPVRQSVLPPDMGFKNGLFDSSTAVRQAMAVLNATGR